MFSLPIIFLCNTVLFALIMKERFKAITTLVVSFVAFVVSLISNSIVSAMFAESATAGMVGNTVCVVWLLIASIFIASNNIAQKIFLALFLVSNYSFITSFTPVLLGVVPLGTAGIVSVLLSNGIYVLVSFLTFALIGKPLQYFYRRGVSTTMIGLCLLQFLCWKVTMGFANEFFNTEAFEVGFFIALFIYAVVIFVIRSIYSAARFKASDIKLTAEHTIIDIQAENFNSMRTNVEAIKTIKKNVDYIFGKIGIMADAGRPDEISRYVHKALARNNSGAIISHYCDDLHINAILATKTAEAQGSGIDLTSDIILGEKNIKTIELAIIINELLASVIKQCENVDGEKYIKLSVLPTETQLTIEAVYTAKQKKNIALQKNTVEGIINYFFQVEEEDDSDIKSIKSIVEKYSGKISVLTADKETITRIGINY